MNNQNMQDLKIKEYLDENTLDSSGNGDEPTFITEIRTWAEIRIIMGDGAEAIARGHC